MFTTEILSRIQFAFTISFHILWPTLNIGLGLFLLIMEVLWIKTKSTVYLSLYKFWVKIFALSFGMGVVTGIPMSFQFGTNFSKFSAFAGSVIGPLIGVEVMTAFFVEAFFIGIMLFGWQKFSSKIHLIATILVVIGTHHSAFWILSLNSWMHTPDGVSIANGVIRVDNWIKVIFNPSFPYRFLHMILACYITSALLIGGTFSYYLLKHRYLDVSKKAISMSLWAMIFLLPLQIFVGDMHGLNTFKHQPAKIAAMEGLWETRTSAPTVLFAIPSNSLEKNFYSIEVPNLSSILLTHSIDGEIKGIKAWAKSDRPNVLITFFAFRVMVGLGVLFFSLSIIGLILRIKKSLYSSKTFLRVFMILTPAGFISTISGWMVSEVGRQPWIITNILRTKQSISSIKPSLVFYSLLAFILIYSVAFICFIVYSWVLIQKGPMSPCKLKKQFLINSDKK